MQLRQRLADDLTARARALLPTALGTAWGSMEALPVLVEELKFKPTGGDDNIWQRKANFTGTLRAELRGDGADSLPVEALIADLVSAPLHLNYDPNVAEGTMTETVRAKLIDWRDSLRDQQVVHALRFSVEGTLAERIALAEKPQLLVSLAPHTGRDHQDKYADIEVPQ